MLVYHGTSTAFVNAIRENGLIPPAGHGRGVRVTLGFEDAKRHARSWAAFALATEQLKPEGLVVVAEVVAQQVVIVRGTYRLKPPGLPAGTFQIRGPFPFPDLDPREEAFDREAVYREMERWADLTDNRRSLPALKAKVRRS